MIRMLPTLWTLPWGAGGAGQAAVLYTHVQFMSQYLTESVQLSGHGCRSSGEYDTRHEA